MKANFMLNTTIHDYDAVPWKDDGELFYTKNAAISRIHELTHEAKYLNENYIDFAVIDLTANTVVYRRSYNMV